MFLSSRWIEWYPFLTKKVNFKIWPRAKLGVTGQVRSKWVILGIIRFGATRQTLWYHFQSPNTTGSKVIGRKIISSYDYNGLGRKLTWPKVTKMKNRRYTFCWHSRQYRILKVSNHSGKNCAHSAKLQFEAGSEAHIWLWPDLVTWPFDLGKQNLHTRCVLELCAGMPNLALLRAAVFKLFAKKTGVWGRICPLQCAC